MARTVSIKHKHAGSGFDMRNLNSSKTDLIAMARKGINYIEFKRIAAQSPFSLPEWSGFLHCSDRTMQRYKLERKTFDPMFSDRILQIAVFYKKGVEVFDDKANFDTWLETKSVVLGGVKPKELLDNTFGINLVMDELVRIENGVLA